MLFAAKCNQESGGRVEKKQPGTGTTVCFEIPVSCLLFAVCCLLFAVCCLLVSSSKWAMRMGDGGRAAQTQHNAA